MKCCQLLYLMAKKQSFTVLTSDTWTPGYKSKLCEAWAVNHKNELCGHSSIFELSIPIVVSVLLPLLATRLNSRWRKLFVALLTVGLFFGIFEAQYSIYTHEIPSIQFIIAINFLIINWI